MNDKDNGLIIEGFVQRSYDRMFENSRIEVRNHPLTAWCQATVSGSETNFETTKGHVICTLDGVMHTLYQDRGNDDLLTELGDFAARLKESQNVDDLGNAINEARRVLDRAFSG
jgi:hypothetical protein